MCEDAHPFAHGVSDHQVEVRRPAIIHHRACDDATRARPYADRDAADGELPQDARTKDVPGYGGGFGPIAQMT